MRRADAIQFVKEREGEAGVMAGNTHVANVNSSRGVWWLDIPKEKFHADLHIILVKNKDSGLIWLKIDSDSIRSPDQIFRIRVMNGIEMADVSICAVDSDGQYLRDGYHSNHYDFRRHIRREW